MVKFLLKCFFCTTILLFGVLLGIYQANHGYMQMQGEAVEAVGQKETESEPKQSALQEGKKHSAETEAVPEKERITSHDLQEKQEQLEEIQAFNFFSQLGVQISDLCNRAFSSLFHQFTSMVDKVLSSIG